MPIEFAPPSPQLQGFNIPPPQYTDPLQTLAQLGQLRTQNLQRQGAQQELEQGQIKTKQAQEDLADQQKLRKVYSDWAQTGNPNLDDLVKQASAAGVGPRTLMPLQQQVLEHRTKLATAKKLDFENLTSTQAQQTQAFNAVASAPPDQRPAAWQTERGRLIAGGFATPNEIAPEYPGDQAFEELRHHSRTSQQELDLAKEQREAEKEEAGTKLTGVQTTEAEQKVAAGEKAAVISELQGAPLDPNTGTPTPAAMAAIQQRHPKVILPAPTKAEIERFIRSGVSVEKQPEYDVNKQRLEQGITGTGDFQGVFLPSYAKNLGKTVKELTPKETMAAFTVYKQYDTNPEMLASILASRAATQQAHQATLNNQEFQRGQQSYQYTNNELDKIAKPIEDAAARVTRLKDVLSQNSPVADALVAPELLTITAGGAGSGLRMTDTELNRIIGARSKWEDLKAAAAKWQLDAKEATNITAEQRREIHALVDAIDAKVRAKQQVISDAREGLLSNDPMEHRRILQKTHEGLQGVDTGGEAAGKTGTQAPPLPKILSASDVGKVYTSPMTGKKLKITAVNPQNPKQFKSVEVQ